MAEVGSSSAGASAKPVIHVLGDSHSRFFNPTRFFLGRIGMVGEPTYSVVAEPIHGAAVAGFRPKLSTLDVKARIREATAEASHVILAFGQVDLELGYYYRLAVKKETWEPSAYVSWLLQVYEDFLADLSLSGTSVALKGVNLTALRPRPFAVRYVSRIVSVHEHGSPRERDRMVVGHLLDEAGQNDMHLAFNAGLRQVAESRGVGYFDLVEETSGEGAHALRDEFLTATFDHHLADTVPVRRMHYLAAGRVFGLELGEYSSVGS